MTDAEIRFEERILAFLGGYSAMQAAIDTCLRLFLLSRMRTLGPAIAGRYIKRISDEERIEFFLNMAKDSGYGGDLSAAKASFYRAQAVRDLVSHSPSVSHVYVDFYDEYRVMIAESEGFSQKKSRRVPDRLVPGSFDRLRQDCRWLADHAWRMAHDANLIKGIDMSGKPIVPPIPPVRPVGGEPI